jgi:hypothetical protein
MASRKSGPLGTTKKNSKTVQVELEKADEQTVMKRPAIAQVPEEVVLSIKNQSQIEEENEQHDQQLQNSQFKNRVLFYGGVAAAVGILFLCHRFSISKKIPPAELIPELINGVAKVATK